MTRVSHGKWWTIIPLYAFGGAVLGLADGQLGDVVKQLGMKPGMATFFTVNIVLPLFAVGLAAIRPFLRTALFGALAMSAGFVLGMAAAHPPARPWNAALLLASIPPVVVLACLGYGVVGAIAVLVTRRLTAPDDISDGTRA